MLKMSFTNGTLDRNKLKMFIQDTDKPIKYTVGLKYRHPTTYEKPISKSEALSIVADATRWLDAEERDNFLDLNEYNANDMW